LYLPVAADASWQKFGVGGAAAFLNKDRAKAKGKERQRCNWPAPRHWHIGHRKGGL
jgi:hypothetical protein